MLLRDTGAPSWTAVQLRGSLLCELVGLTTCHSKLHFASISATTFMPCSYQLKPKANVLILAYRISIGVFFPLCSRQDLTFFLSLSSPLQGHTVRYIPFLSQYRGYPTLSTLSRPPSSLSLLAFPASVTPLFINVITD